MIASGTKEEIKQILASENTISIQADYWNEEFIQRLEDNPVIHRMKVEEKEITIVVSREVNMFSSLAKLAEETKVNLNSVDIDSPTLEDVFLHLTGRALRD